MIIKGKARKDGLHLANYLTHAAKKSNDRVGIVEVRHGSTKDLHKALFDMDIATERTRRGKKGLYHAQVNPAYGEDRQMSKADWLAAADMLEAELGFSGQNRVIVLHEKKGRIHGHIVWQREKDGRLIGISHNYLKHDQARGKIEQQLSHKPTLQPRDHKQALSMLWHNSTDGRTFISKAQAMGYQVGKGERRAYCVITPDGQKLDLVRQLDQVKTHQAKAKLKDVEATLPHENSLAGLKPEKHRTNEKDRRADKLTEKRVAGEKEKDVARNRAKLAQAAALNFADVVQPDIKQEFASQSKTATQPPPPKQENQEPPKREETRQAANENFEDMQMTDTERQLKQIMENMRSHGRRRKL